MNKQLSSLPRHNHHRLWSRTPTTSHQSPHRSVAASIPSIAAIRHASTNTQPTPASPPSTSDKTSFPDLDTIILDNIQVNEPALDISGIPEGIGYLKQIGLDYGIGITSSIQWYLEHVHIWGGLPWWASIVATAFTVRLALFPLFLRSSDMMARQGALVSVMKPINDRMSKAQKEGNTQEVMIGYRQLSLIRKRAGISMPQQFLPLILQGVFGYCGFKLMRACAELPVPGFGEGGFLWLQDLTATDGYLLMPLIMAATFHLIVRLGGETGAASVAMPPQMKKILMWGMPAITALFLAWQPGSVCVWFASTGIMGILQGQALQNAQARRFFGIAPFYKPKSGEQGGGTLLQSMLQDKVDELYGKPSSDSKTTRPASGATAGKNADFMRPTYQSPNLNRQASGRTIDTTLVSPQPSGTPAPASEMRQASSKPTPQKGLFSGVTDKIKDLKEMASQRAKTTPEQQKEAFRKRAARYEQNAQQRGR